MQRALDVATSVAATLARLGAGSRVGTLGARPEKLLELYEFEACPFCRIAREALCRLELPYVLRNVARDSPKRADFVQRSGKMQVPYLADPNTGKEMLESAEIARYLEHTYASPRT